MLKNITVLECSIKSFFFLGSFEEVFMPPHLNGTLKVYSMVVKIVHKRIKQERTGKYITFVCNYKSINVYLFLYAVF